MLNSVSSYNGLCMRVVMLISFLILVMLSLQGSYHLSLLNILGPTEIVNRFDRFRDDVLDGLLSSFEITSLTSTNIKPTYFFCYPMTMLLNMFVQPNPPTMSTLTVINHIKYVEYLIHFFRAETNIPNIRIFV